MITRMVIMLTIMPADAAGAAACAVAVAGGADGSPGRL